MISAIDTDVLLDIARPNPGFVDGSVALLLDAGERGVLVITPVVHAELSARFPTLDQLSAFLSDLNIRVDALTEETTFHAGKGWLEYRKAGGKRNRIISDFLIGSHAQVQASQLITRDRGFYRSYFPGLTVLEPAKDAD